MSGLLWTILAVAGALALWFVFTYNRFITLSNRAKEAWSDIEIQLKRRYDLIPNLIEAVKGYVKHERDTLEKITEARVRAMNAHSMDEHAQTENILSGALKTLFAVSENYPDLKANANFIELQRELADTENKIQSSRRFYNTNVRDLSIQIESFPANIIAGIFKFQKMDLFELIEEAAREPVKVSF